MPARQEGVFTKRLSDKQYIMKAESLLEHKCFFSGFCFYRTAIKKIKRVERGGCTFTGFMHITT
jgi:hypothetical protein